jgi:hypothetical protein
MESLYPPDKSSIPSWDSGKFTEPPAGKLGELNLPEGWKP